MVPLNAPRRRNDHGRATLAGVYQPLPEQLTAEERWFLERVAPMGLDFLTTRQQYQERLGVSSYHGWQDVIALPESRVLSASPLRFVMYADEAVLDLPPEYLTADFMPHDDARANHRDVEQQLSAVLGAPEVLDVSNCLQRRWTFGVFCVELHTFPPELQSPSKNTLHEKNPRLAISSSIAIKSEFALPYPDGSLDEVALAIGAGSSWAVPLDWPATAPGWPHRHASRRYTRRSPRSMTESVSPARLVGWRDASGRLGISGALRSLVFEPGVAAGLHLVTLEPERGPGGLQLEVELVQSPAAGARLGPVMLFDDFVTATGNRALPAAAEQLAGSWRLPLTVATSDGW